MCFCHVPRNWPSPGVVSDQLFSTLHPINGASVPQRFDGRGRELGLSWDGRSGQPPVPFARRHAPSSTPLAPPWPAFLCVHPSYTPALSRIVRSVVSSPELQRRYAHDCSLQPEWREDAARYDPLPLILSRSCPHPHGWLTTPAEAYAFVRSRLDTPPNACALLILSDRRH